MLLIYFLGTSKSLIIHEPTSNYHFYWRCSLEDILGLAIARSLILSVTYAWGVHSVQRCVDRASVPGEFTSWQWANGPLLILNMTYAWGVHSVQRSIISR